MEGEFQIDEEDFSDLTPEQRRAIREVAEEEAGEWEAEVGDDY